MAGLNVSLVLSLIDKLSKPLKSAAKAIDGFGDKSKKAHLGTAAESRKAERAVRAVAVAARTEAKAVNASSVALVRRAKAHRDSSRTVVAAARAEEQAIRRVGRARSTTGRFLPGGRSGGSAAAARGGHSAPRRSNGSGGGAESSSVTPYGHFAAGMGGAAYGRFGVGGVGVAAVGVGVAAGAYAATRSALSMERSMYEVEKATDSSGEAAERYQKAILDLARATGKSKEEIASMLAQAGYAGRPVGDLVRFTEYASKATTAWGTNAEETGQALAELGNIYGADQGRLEEIGDAINTAADISASREGDLLEFIRRAGATGKQSGISAEQTLAFGAALKEVGVRTDVAATGFEALMNVMKLGQEFGEKTREGLLGLGVDSDTMRKQFVAKPLEATLGLLNKINKVADPMKRAEILTNIFGKEYQDDIQKLLNGLPRLNELLKTMGDRTKYAGSVRKQFDLISEKDFNKLERATQALDILGARLAKPIKIGLGSIAEEINEIVDATERGENFLQKLDARRKAYNEERYGSEKSPEEVYGEQVSKPYNDAMADLAKSDLWTKPIIPIPESRADAEREGREAARRDRIADENRTIERAVDLQSRVSKAETARLPPDFVESLRRELAVVAQQVGEIAVRRHVEGLGVIRAETQTEAAPVAPGLAAFDTSRSGIALPAPAVTTPPAFDPNVPHPPARPQVDTTEIEAAEQKAQAVGQAIASSLNVTAAPVIDASSLDAANAKVLTLLGNLSRVGPLMAQANKAAGSQTTKAQTSGFRPGALLQDDGGN